MVCIIICFVSVNLIPKLSDFPYSCKVCIIITCVVVVPFCCRERVPAPKEENGSNNHEVENHRSAASLATTLESPPKSQQEGSDYRNGTSQTGYSARSLLKSASISASKCIGVKQRDKTEVNRLKKAIEVIIYSSSFCIMYTYTLFLTFFFFLFLFAARGIEQ